MIATQTAYPTETSVYPNELDCASIFGIPCLDEQALKIKGGFNNFFKNLLDNNLKESNELWGLESLCIAKLGVAKGKQAFKAWLKSLGSGAEYLAKGIMKFGRWFNTIEERYQKVLRDDVQSWQISWLKKLMKFPVEELVDAAVEGHLKEVVLGGMKQKKRELHVDGYAKIVCDPHNLNLKGKIGRIVHYCEEKSEWLWELPDSELADSGLPDSGLATSNWFTADQLEVANKPRNISKQAEQQNKQQEDKCLEPTQTVELKNQDESSPEITASNIAPTSTQAVYENQSTIPVDVQVKSSSPSSIVDLHSQNETGKENGRLLSKEVSELFEENKSEPGQMSAAQIKALLGENQRLRNQAESNKHEAQAELELIRRDAEKIALAKAESIFSEQLQQKDLELAELRLQQSALSNQLIFTPQELDEHMRAAIAAEQDKNAKEIQAALVKAESIFGQQLKEKDLEVAELRLQQSDLSGKLIFTPQEFDERVITAIAAVQEKSALEVQTALAKAESHFIQQLQQKDLELAELLKQQSDLSGKLIFTPQEFADSMRAAIAADREKSAFVFQANQDHHQELEEKKQSIQQQMSESHPALYQATTGSQSDVDEDTNTPSLDKKPNKEYDALREEVEQYKAVVYSFVKASVESIEAITPRIAQDALTEIIAVSDQTKTESNVIQSSTNTEERVNSLETQLKEALYNNRNLACMVKQLQINIELREEVHKAELESTKRYNQNGYSSTKPRTFLPFEPSPNRKRK